MHATCTMRGRWQIWLAIALCVAVFITFLVHKPACSSSNMRHHKPVAKFKALTRDVCDKAGSPALAEFSVTRLVVTPMAPQWERAAVDVSTLQTFSSQVLSCRLNC